MALHGQWISKYSDLTLRYLYIYIYIYGIYTVHKYIYTGYIYISASLYTVYRCIQGSIYMWTSICLTYVLSYTIYVYIYIYMNFVCLTTLAISMRITFLHMFLASHLCQSNETNFSYERHFIARRYLTGICKYICAYLESCFAYITILPIA